MKEKTKSVILLFVISLILIPSFIYGASAKRSEQIKEENMKKVLTSLKVSPDQVEIPLGSNEKAFRSAIKVLAYYKKVSEPTVVLNYETDYNQLKEKIGRQRVTIKYTENGCSKKCIAYIIFCSPQEETPQPSICPGSPKPTCKPPQSSSEDADINFPYISGYTDNTFRPNQAVTREELATMIARLITKNRIPNESNQFSDVVPNRFSTDAINYITRLGIMKPATANTFNPNGTVSYKEFQEIVNRLNPYIKNENVSLPTGDGSLTRVQAIVALNRLFNVQCSTSYIESPFKDINKDTPYYDDIVCATSSRVEPR